MRVRASVSCKENSGDSLKDARVYVLFLVGSAGRLDWNQNCGRWIGCNVFQQTHLNWTDSDQHKPAEETY